MRKGQARVAEAIVRKRIQAFANSLKQVAFWLPFPLRAQLQQHRSFVRSSVPGFCSKLLTDKSVSPP